MDTFVLMLVVGLGAIFFSYSANKEIGVMNRAPYFFFFTTIMLVFSISLFFIEALGAHFAMQGQVGEANYVLIVLLAVSMGAMAYYCMQIAMARSRDAFGTTKWAFLTFIPLLNLVLLFSPPREPRDRQHIGVPRYSKGASGVVLGIFLLILGIVVDSAAKLVFVDSLSSANASYSSKPTVSDTLRLAFDGISLPITVDEITTLTNIEVVENKLIRTYQVDLTGITIDSQKIAGIVNGELCNNSEINKLMFMGAIIQSDYFDNRGIQLASVTTTSQDC